MDEGPSTEARSGDGSRGLYREWQTVSLRWHLFVVWVQIAFLVSSVFVIPREWDVLAYLWVVAFSSVTLLSVGSPLIGFGLSVVYDGRTMPIDEAPRQSGTLLGIDWFTFQSDPDRWFVSPDSETSARVRAQPTSWAPDGGFQWRSAAPSLLPSGRSAAWTNGRSMILASMIWVPLMGAAGWFGDPAFAFVVGVLWALAVGVLGVVYPIVSLLFRWGSRRVLRRMSGTTISLEGDLLRVGRQTFHLAHPSFKQELGWDAYGACLALGNAEEELLIWGEHQQLRSLMQVLDARPDPEVDETQRQAVQRLVKAESSA